MNELAYLKHLPETKLEIENYSTAVINLVKEGNADPLELIIRLKAIENTIKKIVSGIKDYAHDEALKHSDKIFDFKNAKIEIAQTGVKYDYSGCNDDIWNESKKIESEHSGIRKEREEFLKTIKETTSILNEETGEIIKINPPIKKGKESIKITLK